MLSILHHLLEGWGGFSAIFAGVTWSGSWKQNSTLWDPAYDWVPLESLILTVVHTEPPAAHRLQFRFSYPSTGSWGGFCCSEPWLPAFACLSNFGSSGVPCVSPFMNPGKVDFLVCSASYLLLEWSGDSQAPSMQKRNRKSRSWLSTSSHQDYHCSAYSHRSLLVFFLNWIIWYLLFGSGFIGSTLSVRFFVFNSRSSVLLLCSVPLYDYTSASLSVLLLMDIWVVSSF